MLKPLVLICPQFVMSPWVINKLKFEAKTKTIVKNIKNIGSYVIKICLFFYKHQLTYEKT